MKQTLNKKIRNKILKLNQMKNGFIYLKINGSSMNPIIMDNDIVFVIKCLNYEIGDILIFNYYNDDLLAHRLINKIHQSYICKGDNSYNVEIVTKDKIIGKVTKIKRKDLEYPVSKCSEKLILLSNEIYKLYFKLNYNIEKLQETDLFCLYKKIVLENNYSINIYFLTKKGRELLRLNKKNMGTNNITFYILNLLKIPQSIETIEKKVIKDFSFSTEIDSLYIQKFIQQNINYQIIKSL